MSPTVTDQPPPTAAVGHCPKPPRLLGAAGMVPRGSRVADIGSGHGLLPRLLLASGRASHCIASERNPATLARVRPLPPHLPWARRLELRWGDGLTVLEQNDRVDVAILLGLGARTIGRILDDPVAARLSIRRFVFGPQTEWPALRAGLERRSLAIREERLVRDRGRIYLLLAAEPTLDAALPSHADLSPIELLEVGPMLARSADPLVLEVWRRELQRRGDIAERTTGRRERRESRAAAERARRIVAVLESNAGEGRSTPGEPVGL